MKRILLTFTALICITTYFSCKKENSTPMSQLKSTTNNGPTAWAVTQATEHWEESAKDCSWPATDCNDQTPTFLTSELTPLNQLIDLGGTALDFATYFSSPGGIAVAQKLALDQLDLSHLQSGTYKVIRCASGSTPGLMYYFFGPVPLSRLHHEFVVPVPVQ